MKTTNYTTSTTPPVISVITPPPMPRVDDFIFEWFNTQYPKEMLHCLQQFDELHLNLRGDNMIVIEAVKGE